MNVKESVEYVSRMKLVQQMKEQNIDNSLIGLTEWLLTRPIDCAQNSCGK